MSAATKQITAIGQRIRALYVKENTERRASRRWICWLSRWGLMLYHEVLCDDVKVRAESLAFLTIFSLLPLIAGAFAIFAIFAHLGFVQDALRGFFEQFLGNIPDVHRDFIRDYVIQFKNAYLASLTQKSGSVGIFALFILIWVGIRTFRNVDEVLNHIWNADKQRPLLEQIRNFLVVVVVAPLVLVSALSVPLVLHELSATRYVFQLLPLLSVLLNTIVTPLVITGTFFSLYKFVPVRRVRWKSAVVGAVFATVCFQVANYVLHLYFLFGTNSAYGKAAIVPLIGVWIYVVWLIIILGGEVSYLMQNQKDILFGNSMEPTLREGGALFALLAELCSAQHQGKNPVGFEVIRSATGLTTSRLHLLLDYLSEKKIVLECVTPVHSLEGAYVLGRDPDSIDLASTLHDFYRNASDLPANPFEKIWSDGLQYWFGYFRGLSLTIPTDGKNREHGHPSERP